MTGWGRRGEMYEQEVEARDTAPVVERCAFCEWTFTGTVIEGREASLEHRRAEHPDCVVYVRPRKARQVVQSSTEREISNALAARSRTLSAVSQRRLTEEQLAEAARRYEAGEPARSIAATRFEAWGYASVDALAVALYPLLRERVAVWRGRGSRAGNSSGRLNEERVAVVVTLYEARWSSGQIAHLVRELWGFGSEKSARNAICRALSAQGIEARGRQRVEHLPELSRSQALALIDGADGARREAVFTGSREGELAFRGVALEAV